MPNIKIKTTLKEEDVNDFMREVSSQVRAQTGRGFQWNFDGVNLHYEPESVEEKVLQEGDKRLHSMFGNKVTAGKSGAYSISRGKLKKAMKVFMAHRGYAKVDFREWM